MSKKMVCIVSAIAALITGGVSISDPLYRVPVGEVKISGSVIGRLLVSPRGLDLIGNAEGCRRDPYRCPSGLMTNGIGNTHQVPDHPVDEQQIAKDWVMNILSAQRCFLDAVNDKNVTQGQMDAFVSFIFNTGCQRFKHNRDGSETQIGKLVRTGHYRLACKELNRWVWGGGVKLPGLVTRRYHETEVCLSIK